MTAVWVKFEDKILPGWSLETEDGKALGPRIWINRRDNKCMGWANAGGKIYRFDTLEKAKANLIARWRLTR